jgi:N4-gp56 family major capsid protein
MAMTEFALSAALAVQRWASDLAYEAEKAMYFRKFMGAGPGNIIRIRKELNKKAGEKITFGLRMKPDGPGVEGDNIIEGTSAEVALDFYNDSVFIDQLRKGTKSKGKMSEQRVPYNMRKEGRDALAIWWAEELDEELFIYLSGHRGATVATDFHNGLSWTGRANNSLQTPDSGHNLWAGNATSMATIDANDKMDMEMVERCVAKLETADPMIQPAARIGGEMKFVLVMHTWCAYDVRRSISQGDWLEIHKATDSAKSPIYRNALGEYAGVVLHKHRNVIRFTNANGSTASGVTAARNLLLGAQAGAIAWGGNGGPGRYSWNEEKDDRGNALVIDAGSIFGITKIRFNSADFGVIAVDSYCDDPNS